MNNVHFDPVSAPVRLSRKVRRYNPKSYDVRFSLTEIENKTLVSRKRNNAAKQERAKQNRLAKK